MYSCDFVYDNQYLSDFNFIICNFDNKNGVTNVSAGSELTFTKVKTGGGTKYNLVSAIYDSCLTSTFEICKNPEIFDGESMAISDDEYRDIMRWLNRKEFLKFAILYDEKSRDVCYYDASFNIEKIYVGDVLYGLKLTVETNRPFGYGEDIVFELDMEAEKQYTLYDVSDEIGYIYPDLEIICEVAGDFMLTNSASKSKKMIILNCSSGEVLRFHGETLLFTTSEPAHDICNDFNYNFFRIANSYEERRNIIKASLPCKLKITYKPIIKNSI